jgi:uncharacterized membrane protein YqaE (UPF0057 family)
MLVSLFEAIGNIFLAFEKIGEIIIFILDIMFTVIPQMEIIFNPVKFINDIIYGFIKGVSFFLASLKNRLQLDKYFGNYKNETNSPNCNRNNTNGLNNKNCYKTTLIQYIILIVCPPLAIFSKHGFSQIFSIFICSILTVYAYYFPGLLYAILMIKHDNI